jgi:hypothetical protein
MHCDACKVDQPDGSLVEVTRATARPGEVLVSNVCAGCLDAFDNASSPGEAAELAGVAELAEGEGGGTDAPVPRRRPRRRSGGNKK